MIVKIHKSSISRIEMLYDPKGRTMEQWHKDYGFNYGINTVLFDLDYDGLAGYLTTDNKVLCQAANPYGFASDGKKLVFSYGNNVNYPDFAGFAYATLIRDGKIQVGSAETAKYGYRQRSAVGLTKDDDIVLLCDRTNRSLPGIAGDMKNAGCVIAGNYDGGDSASIWTPNGSLNGRPVMAILAIWTGDNKGKDDKKEETEVATQKVVCIDPGHSAAESNGSPDGTYKEHEFALDVGKRVKKILERHGIKVVMTREDGSWVDLYQRAKISNNAKADYFVSLHTNSNASGKWGTECGYEVHICGTGGKAEVLANKVIKYMDAIVATPNRGVKVSKNLVVLKYTDCPAVLIEHGFHTHQLEVENLKDIEFRDRYAEADARAILDILGIKYVSDKQWYDNVVKWAVANGISDGSNPEKAATRAEVMAMLYRYDMNRKEGKE